MKTTICLSVIAFTLSVLPSCQKEKGENNTIASPYYFTATINGAAVKYEANDINSTYACGLSQPESLLGDNDNDIYEGTVIANPSQFGKSSIYVHVLKYFSHYPSDIERINMITLGNYPYGYSEVSSSTINGASIHYYDANGKYWSSENGPQTGSSFSITELVNNSNGTSAKNFKASFSCKLYSEDGTQSIEVTNATIRGKILFP
jgi:hypothetical protein